MSGPKLATISNVTFIAAALIYVVSEMKSLLEAEKAHALIQDVVFGSFGASVYVL